MKMNIKYASMFSGIGGFEFGIQKATPIAECVFSCESDKYARAIYRKQFKTVTSNDIRTVKGSDIQGIDLICAGFPCQDVSIAGERCGLQGERSGLVFELIRIIRESKPKHILLENVKGLLSSNAGWDFARILIELENIGYCIEWNVINSKNFGVPQHRERVYIIGHLGGFSGRKVFPIRQSEPENHIRIEEKRFIDLQLEGSQLTNISRTIQARYYKGYSARYGENSGVLVNGMSPEPIVCALRQLYRNGRLYHNDGYANTVQTSGREDGILLNNRIRRLTPLEIERLQGFPDNFTSNGINDNDKNIIISDTQRYKCLGNAVTTNVITAIIQNLYEIK